MKNPVKPRKGFSLTRPYEKHQKVAKEPWFRINNDRNKTHAKYQNSNFGFRIFWS